jgi:hypothetical protein
LEATYQPKNRTGNKSIRKVKSEVDIKEVLLGRDRDVKRLKKLNVFVAATRE